MCSGLFLSMVFDDELNKQIEQPLKYCILKILDARKFSYFLKFKKHSTHLRKLTLMQFDKIFKVNILDDKDVLNDIDYIGNWLAKVIVF